MIIDDTILYEKKHEIKINDTKNSIYYYFDYDERNADINMEFQHFHPFYEILILLCQEANHLLEGKSYRLLMGDMILLPPYCLHKSVYKEGNPSKRIIINFIYPNDLFGLPNGYSTLLKPFHDEIPIFRFSHEQKIHLFTKLNEIFKYSKLDSFNNSELNQIMIHAKFLEFLNTLLQLKPYNIYRNDSDNSSTTQKIYEISSYIHNHFHEDLSLEFLANKFYMSPYYLSHQFKKVTNFTVSAYIQMTRIKNAQYQLVTTNKRITDIANSCGFSSFSQFNRVFNKMNNMSPSEFRKNGSLSTGVGEENIN